MRQLVLGRPGLDQEHYGEVQELLEGGQRLVHVVHGFEQLGGGGQGEETLDLGVPSGGGGRAGCEKGRDVSRWLEGVEGGHMYRWENLREG